jgi:hypothetical protein
MICPRCGSNQNDQVKFCTVCGGNLAAVRQALEMRDTDDKFDWTKTWVAEMFMSADEQKRRREAMEIARGITPEIKRYKEIKAGVILSSIGIALSIFLFVFMQGLILNSQVSRDAAAILSHVWIAGVIPFMIGLALIVNGLIVSKKLVEIANRETSKDRNLAPGVEPPSLPPAETNEFIPTPFSVTEQTTKHLSTSDQK